MKPPRKILSRLIPTLILVGASFGMGALKYQHIKRTPIPEATFSEVEKASKSRKNGVILLDARGPSTYSEGHIPNAKSYPKGDPAPLWLASIPKEMPIIVYCSGGDCADSTALAKQLRGEGRKNIKVYEGGWEEWVAVGQPQEHSSTENTP